jgi:hypothetical protein
MLRSIKSGRVHKGSRKNSRFASICLGLLVLGYCCFAVQQVNAHADGPSSCVTPKKLEIGHGKTPDAPGWSAQSSIKNNGSCEYWLLTIHFHLPRVTNWSSGISIKADGHLPSTQRIDAMDRRGRAGSAAFSGFAGSVVGKVRASFASGDHVDISPRYPPKRLRSQSSWLRGFVCFVRYHPVDDPVTSVAVFDRSDKLLYRVKGNAGSFF